jgi:hypothetical protein
MTGFTFNVTTTTQTAGGTKREVDWDALNKHVIEMAKTDKKARSIPGVISGIIDLGEQSREDAEYPFDGGPEKEAAETAKFPATYFKDGFDEKNKPCRLKCYPQKPVQQVAITVDFPQVLVDKGQFFGNSAELPLRMLLNGEFQLSDGVKIVGRPYSIVETKYDDGTWAFAKNNGLHKLADAADLLDTKGYFTKNRIGELLGKVVQFEFRVYMKPSKKDASKTYFTEDIKLVGKLPEGIVSPEIPEGILYGVNLFGDIDVDAVKQLRLSVRNTIKKALNYETSDIKAVLDAQATSQGSPAPRQEAPKADEAAPVLKASAEETFDDDVPF